jgi:hypothetical protein
MRARTGPLQATVLRVLLRAANPLIHEETKSWAVQEFPAEIQKILGQHRSRRHPTSAPWLRLAQLRRKSGRAS